jgi:nitrate reductase gamma subunit
VSAAPERATFRVIGLLGLGVTLVALGSLLDPARFPIHAVLIPVATAAATWWVGRWADRWVRERPRAHALWLGPVCAVAVLGAGALAVLLSNVSMGFTDPEPYLLRPMVAALGAVPIALLAGFLCGLLALVALVVLARRRLAR